MQTRENTNWPATKGQRENLKKRNTADLDRGLELEEIGLGEEDFTRRRTESTDLILGELHLTHSPRVPELQQAIDDVIQDGRLYPLPVRGHLYPLFSLVPTDSKSSRKQPKPDSQKELQK